MTIKLNPGDKFGMLTVVRYVGTKYKTKTPVYLCQCDCGNSKATIGRSLVNGECRSCGCIHSKAHSIDPAERFEKSYRINPDTGCWDWTKSLVKGYGQIRVYGKTIKAHQLSYMLHKGNIPTDHFVCHTCDTPHCVNPDHLFTGTALDNMQDMSKKGRAARGSKQHLSKYTESEITYMRESGKPAMWLWEHFERRTHWSTVYKILNKETWNHVK